MTGALASTGSPVSGQILLSVRCTGAETVADTLVVWCVLCPLVVLTQPDISTSRPAAAATDHPARETFMSTPTPSSNPIGPEPSTDQAITGFLTLQHHQG